jgi:hypothetical protein
MTIPDDKAERAGGPSDAELAAHLRDMAERISERGHYEGWVIERFYIAAQRLEDRSEISEAMVEKASESGFEVYRHSSALPWRDLPKKSKEWWRSIFRAALAAAIGGEE